MTATMTLPNKEARMPVAHSKPSKLEAESASYISTHFQSEEKA